MLLNLPIFLKAFLF
jgi:hypothetical protein